MTAFDNFAIEVFTKKRERAELYVKLRKRSLNATEIDLTLDSIAVPSSSEDLQKDHPPYGEVLSLGISLASRSVGHAEEWARNERQSSSSIAKIGTRKIGNAHAARRTRTVFPRIPPRALRSIELRCAISREAIWWRAASSPGVTYDEDLCNRRCVFEVLTSRSSRGVKGRSNYRARLSSTLLPSRRSRSQDRVILESRRHAPLRSRGRCFRPDTFN